MDIRNWLTSPKTLKNTAATKVSPTKRKKEEKKVSKKRKIISDSDSDEEVSSKRNQKINKKDNCKKSPGKRKFIQSSDEDNFKDFDSPKSKCPKVKKSLRNIEAKSSKEIFLKPATVTDFFGNARVERLKKTPIKNDKISKTEENHEDDDFNKTLLQLEETPEKKIKKKKISPEKNVICDLEINSCPKKTTPTKKYSPLEKEYIEEIPSSEEDSLNQTSPSKKSSSILNSSSKNKNISPKKKKASVSTKESKLKRFSSDIEFEPSPKQTPKKKEIIKESPLPKDKKKTGNAANYMSYLHRDGPRALGSKEIPEGEEGCLEGKTFLVTGVLESITRDETKDLIEKYGGKLMTTLSKNTTYIVVGRDAGPAKLEKAEKLGTKQLTEDQLLELIKTTPGRGPLKKKSPEKIKTHIEGENFANEVLAIKPEVPEKKILETADRIPSFEMWVDKYKPKTLKQIIGQNDEKSNAKKLLKWLINWNQNTKNKKPAVAGRWNAATDGAGFKAALLSGPPGVGKTTTAQLVCKEANFDYFELNASDTRSKKSLQQVIAELVHNQSLASCFKDGMKGSVSRNHAVIMDEVDGMAGNEDRGGMQELISFIKASRVPIICICNDRNHPKIRSLSNYCFDLRFMRPRMEQIKAAMMSVAYKEGLKVAPNVLQDIITASNQDIRQVLHNLSMWSAKDKCLSAEQAKIDIGQGTKHIKMNPFDVLRDVFTIGQNPKATINDKASLFFHDYSIAPLFVQENYVHVLPAAAANDKMKHMHLLSECADSICVGDIIEKQIRTQGSWNLLPVEAIFASVVPGNLLTGNLKQMINFPAWLGKNSNRNHMDRILQELQMHMRMRTTGSKTDIALEYLPLLRHSLTKPLLEKESDGVPDVLKSMEYYCLLREDFDSIIDLSLWSNQIDPRSKISSKVKSAFTRAYNKECSKNPYSVSAISKKKKGSVKNDLLGDEDTGESEEENEDNDKLENDSIIKVKKMTKGTKNEEKVVKKTASKSTTKKSRTK